MPDVEITYNNSTIVSMSDSGTEVLETSGTYLTDDITVQYTKSGGGGSTTSVSSSYSSMGAVIMYLDTNEIPQTYDVGVDPNGFSATCPSGSLITVISPQKSAATITNATLYEYRSASSGSYRWIGVFQVD